MPGMSGCSSNCNSYSVQASDVFVLKGGSTWTFASTTDNLITIATASITIRGGQQLGTPWGTGFPVLNAPGSTIPRAGIRDNNASNLLIDGIKITNIEYCSGTTSGGDGIYLNGTISNVEVKNSYFDKVGDQELRFVVVGNNSKIYFHDNVVYNTNRIFIPVEEGNSLDDIQIYNNKFYGPGNYCPTGLTHVDGVHIGSSCTTNTCLTNLKLYNNQWKGDWSKGSTAPVNLNNGNGPAPSGSCAIVSNAKCKSAGNFWSCCTGAGTGTCPNTPAYSGNHVQIYNNVIATETAGPTQASPGWLVLWGQWEDVKIYNNSFGAPNSDAGGSCIATEWGSSNIDIKNNILSGCTNGITIASACTTSVTANYNFYETASGANFRYINGWPGQGSADCRSLAACRGGVFNQEANGKSGNPLYVAIPNGSVGSGDWNLQAGSTAINSGATLAYFSTDYLSVSRPQGAAWDIGAYEYTTGPYTVTASIGNVHGSPAGTIDGVTTPVSKIVSAGSTTSFYAASNTGSHIYSVGGNCGSTVLTPGVNTLTYTTDPVNSNCSVVATFGQYVQTSEDSGGHLACPAMVINGESVTCTWNPIGSYHLATVSGCGTSWVYGNTVTTGNLVADCQITVTSAANTWLVTPSGGSNGTVSPNSSRLAANNEMVGFVITPSPGYYPSITTTCAGYASYANNVYKFGPVTGNCSFQATFLPYSTQGTHGGISVTGGKLSVSGGKLGAN